MIENIIKDIEEKLNIKIDKDDIKYYTEGATESIVFSIQNKYLVKTADDLTLKTQVEFLKLYEDIDSFQNVILYSNELKYIVFEFVSGEKMTKVSNLDISDMINQIIHIVKLYKKYDDKYFGYLYDNEGKNWKDFLKEEINYAMPRAEKLDLKLDILDKALETIEKYDIEKYLIHGDFGAHNFIIDNGKLMVIDPMPVVGDPLFDFYFAILSAPKLFKDIPTKEILGYFGGDYEYKLALYSIILFIRTTRAAVYDKQNLRTYIERFKEL